MPPFLDPDAYPPATRGRIIVWGMLGSQPFGGMAWQIFHYLVPLRRLGFDVWYVEDSERRFLDPFTHEPTLDYSENARLVGNFMERIGFEDRWVIRPPRSLHEHCFGAIDSAALDVLYREADAALNLCGAQELRERHDEIRRLIYLETDPVEMQIHVARGVEGYISQLDRYDMLFSYGENLGSDDCSVPVCRYEWQPTRPPVCLDLWRTDGPADAGARMTTVANLTHSKKNVEWNGEAWRWSKHHEFKKFINVPRPSVPALELALGPGVSTDDLEEMHRHGWTTVSARALDDPSAYRAYIQNSLGEFSVAKEQYVRPRSGWFSDRSVCYLAAGRPVVLEDTAFDRYIPVGEGLLSFRTEDEAVAALETIAAEYERHSTAAIEVAREYFGAEKVVGDLMRRAGLL